MNKSRYLIPVCFTLATVAGWACGSDTITAAGTGHVRVQLTDAPFPSDSVDSVNVYVTRVDLRVATADSGAADSAISPDSASAYGWVTVAEPGSTFNLIELQNGTSVNLGETLLSAGHYSGMRVVIDPSQSRVVLKNGLVLTGSSDPGVKFPSGSSSGLKVTLNGGFDVAPDDTTTVMVDFNLDQSFVLRGNSIAQLGLLFKPVIQASVVTP